jgi:hypothetical protein
MSLLPIYLTAHINNIYYYYCQDCSAVPPRPKYVGAQDTRPHTTGVNCSNILDPMVPPVFEKPSIQEARATRSATATVIGDVPVIQIGGGSGLEFGSSFDPSFDDKIQLAPLGVVLSHYKEKRFKSTFKLSDDSQRSVRLFDIRVSWVTDTGQKTDILRVGQELENPAETPPGPDAITEDGEDVATDSTVKFVKIVLKDTGGEYYVLLK